MSTVPKIIAVTIIMASSIYAVADVETGIEHRAFCVTERLSLGGWVSFEHDAIANAEEHLDIHDDHEVDIQSRPNDEI